MPLGLAFETCDGDPPVRLTSAGYSESPIFLSGLTRVTSASDGLTAFARLALGELARRRAGGDPSGPPFSLTGGSKSSAQNLHKSYDDAKSGKAKWPRTIFGGWPPFQRCLDRDRPNGGYKVWLTDATGPIHVWLDGTAVTAAAPLAGLAAKLFGSTPNKRKLRLGLLRSGDLSYTRDIAEGLMDGLGDRGYACGEPIDVPGPTVAPELPGGGLHPDWQVKLRNFDDRGGRDGDYLVAVGTQAAVALRAHYGPDFGRPGRCPRVLFLGVTYPVACYLVDSLHSRFEPREVCGVAYGADGLRSIAGLIHNWLLPDRRCNFVYFAEHLQDREAAEQLRRTRLYRDGALGVVETTPAAFADAVADPAAVYFSWYTFESIFEPQSAALERCGALLRERTVVATTRLNCRDGLAPAAVSADDAVIGRTGADLIDRRESGVIAHFGRESIAIPEVRYWVHRRAAVARGIEFSAAVWEGAADRYGVDGSDNIPAK